MDLVITTDHDVSSFIPSFDLDTQIMNSDAEDAFARRQQDGTYDDVLQQMEDLKSMTLAEQEYEIDFFRSPERDNLGCYKFLDIIGEEMTTILYGQVCHSHLGTAIGAAGSYTGNQVRFYVLFLQTFSNRPYRIAYQRQYFNKRQNRPVQTNLR